MKSILLIGLFSIIVLLITILVSTRKYVEKRISEGFGKFYDEQNPYTQKQGDYYQNRINRTLPTNTGLDGEMKILNKAMFSVDTYLNVNNVPIAPPFGSEEDPMPAFRARNLRECIPVKSPKYLPPHTKNPPVSCGWWYRDDDNKQSVGYLGTSNGPIDLPTLQKQYPGGEWLWDLDKAQRLEDAKKCRRIRSCETADFYPLECGFCSSLNKGIPVNADGSPKYPTFPNISCERTTIRNPSNCPKPQPVPKIVTLKNGQTLKSGDILPNGKPVPYAAPPRQLCDPDPSKGTLTRDCLIMLARTTGFSNDGVLLKILNGDTEGYYYRTGANNDFFMIVWRIFKSEAKYPLNGGMFGDGAISKAEVTAAYKRIFTLTSDTPILRAKNAARWLVYGTKFDPCDYDMYAQGPFDEQCLERVALEAGCQRDGYRFPNPTNYGDYFAMRWSTVIQYFRDTYDRMQNKDIKQQKQATLDCLGIKVATDPDLVCEDEETYVNKNLSQNPSIQAAQARIDKWRSQIAEVQSPYMKQLLTEQLNLAIKGQKELVEEVRAAIARSMLPPKPKRMKSGPGTEVLWYSWNYDNTFNSAKYTDQPFWGRVLFNSKQFMPDFCTGGGEFNPFGQPDRMAFRLRASLVGTERATKRLAIQTDDGLDVQVDKKTVLSKFHDQGPTLHQTDPFIVSATPVPLKITWFENQGYACFQPKIVQPNGQVTPISAKDVRLRVSTQFPLSRWDFYLQADFDRNEVLNSSANGTSYGTVDGKKAIAFDGPNPWIKIYNPIRGSAYRSFAYMVYCTSVPGGHNRLFALRGAGYNDWGPSVAIEGGMTSGAKLWMGLKAPNAGYENLWIESPGGVFSFNRWHHIVFSFDSDMKGGTIFVDGVKVASNRNDGCNGNYFLTQFYNGSCIGHSHYPFEAETSGQPFRGAMSYVHWFDYSLSRVDCIADMKNMYIEPTVYPEKAELIEREITGGSNKVVFYSRCGYQGKATELSEGDYPFNRLIATGYQNDTLQAVRIPKGYTVILYEHDIGGGRELKLTADTPCLEGLNYMNTTSSCRILPPSSGGQIKVMRASYGANCPGRSDLVGNRTSLIAKACDNKRTCDFTYNYTQTGGDPAGGCPKTLVAEYTCDGINPKKASVPAEAGFDGKLRLDC